MATQTRTPTGDILTTHWFRYPSSDTFASKINSDDGDTSYIYMTYQTSAACYFASFSPFSVPANSTNISLTITYIVAANGSGCTGGGAIQVGGSPYTPDSLSIPLSWTTETTTWNNNPATGQSWTVNDINSVVGGSPLQGFGVWGATYGNYALRETYIYATVTYTPSAPASSGGSGGSSSGSGLIARAWGSA